MPAINNVIAQEESTCAGNAVKTVFSGILGRSDAVILHNPGAASLWYRVDNKNATPPVYGSTFTSLNKMGIVLPGATVIIPMNINGAALYLVNETGAATANEYCAYATDGGTPA